MIRVSLQEPPCVSDMSSLSPRRLSRLLARLASRLLTSGALARAVSDTRAAGVAGITASPFSPTSC